MAQRQRKKKAATGEPGEPVLVPIERPFVGATIEEALLRFEQATGEEEPDARPEILERAQREDGVWVRYRVRFKISVFDDYPYGERQGVALVRRSEPATSEEYVVVSAARRLR